MNDPRIWIWVWTLDACEGGDLDAIVAKAKAYDVGLIVKTHDGLSTFGAWDRQGRLRELIARCVAAGVPVEAWGYVYPTVDLAGQAETALRAGVGYCADAEVEWDGHATEARVFVNYLLARRQPGQRLSYAPLPIVSYHDAGGQYEEFNRLDVARPQAYAGTGGRSAIGALEWSEAEWDRAFPGCHIEPALYAADQDASDLWSAIAFCFAELAAHRRAFGDGAVSVWSYQHMTDEHWAVIDEFTKENDMAFKDDPDAIAFREDVRQTDEAIKAVLSEHAKELADLRTQVAAGSTPAHDLALVNRAIQLIGQTLYSKPPAPPFPGAQYSGESPDFSTTVWWDPAIAKNRFFVDGVETGDPQPGTAPTPVMP